MARHPWVAEADEGVRFGVQLAAEQRRFDALDRVLHESPRQALLENGKLVEQLGFDGLFIYDHPGQAPDPWVWLSGLATVTERVRLGSVVNCIYHRHPVYLARLAADLDHLSDGRLMLGLGVGYLKKEFEDLGAEFPETPDRLAGMEEVVKIIRGVWGARSFSHQGRYYQIDDAHVLPGPIQEPRPPLMIGGGGEKVTLRQVAQYADACNINAGDGTNDDVRRKLGALERHCEAIGRSYDEVLRSDFTGWLIMAPTEDEVQTKLRNYYPEGVPQSMHRMIRAGTPEQIIEHYQGRVDAGMQYFVVQIIDGTDQETIRMLAEDVAPHVH